MNAYLRNVYKLYWKPVELGQKEARPPDKKLCSYSRQGRGALVKGLLEPELVLAGHCYFLALIKRVSSLNSLTVR